MKTRINKYGWLLACLLMIASGSLFTACSDDDNETPVAPEPIGDPKLEVLNDIHSFSFSSAGNAAKVLLFNCNRDWHIEMTGDSTDLSWLTVFDRSGKAGDSTRVWVAAAENDSTDARRASFNLVSGDLIESFEIYQAQHDAVVITDPHAYENLSADEHIIPIEFASNIDDYEVTVSSNASRWCTQTVDPNATRAMISHTVWFKVAANDKFDMRNATITIQSKSNKTATASMYLFQLGQAKPTIKVNNLSDFSSLTAGARTIEVIPTTTNVASVKDQLTVDIPSADRDWITFEPNAAGTGFLIHIDANEAGARTSNIAIAALADHNVKCEIPVKQAAAAGVTVTITNKDQLKSALSKKGGTLTVKVSAPDNNWNAKITDEEGNNVSWVKIASKISNMVIVTFDENRPLHSRKAIVKVFPSGNEAKADKITLTQSAGTCIPVEGGLKNTLDKLVESGYFTSLQDITRLELSGNLTDGDWNLLKQMLIASKGYSLNTIDLTEVTNTTMPAQAFRNCDQLVNISFPKTVKSLPRNVCMSCGNLRTAKINEGTEVVEHEAFNGCSKLSEIWIPSTMTYLYARSFQNCKAVTKIHFQCMPLQLYRVVYDASDPKNFQHVFQGANPSTATLYVPTNYVSYYRNPDVKHVAAGFNMKTYLSGLDQADFLSTAGRKVQDYVGTGGSLQSYFMWTNASTKIHEEDSWE